MLFDAGEPLTGGARPNLGCLTSGWQFSSVDFFFLPLFLGFPPDGLEILDLGPDWVHPINHALVSHDLIDALRAHGGSLKRVVDFVYNY